MPILLKPDPAEPLSQGDLLRKISLFESPDSWGATEQPSRPVKCAGCIVVSRPCVVSNKKYVLVAMVDSYQENPKGISSAEEVAEFLTAVRDGETAPDKFYLGQIPELGAGRFRANLDSIHRVALPANTALADFLKENRVARLSSDFARDLHVRIFRAFASLGFDDLRWMSDADLGWLVGAVEKEIAEVKACIASAKASGEVRMLESNEKRLKELQARYQPYIDEHLRR